MKKYNTGILGGASIALRSIAHEINTHDLLELTAIATRSEDKKRKIAEKFSCNILVGYETLLKDKSIEFIYIPLPNSLHKEWVIKSLEAGKHVLCEKSIGCNYKEAEEMVNVAQKNNLLLVENFQFRFHSQHKEIKKIIDSGEIGEIKLFRSTFGFPPFPDKTNIRYSLSLGGGALLDAGAYTLKAASFVLGNNIKIQSSNIISSEEYDVDITGSISGIFDEKIPIQLSYGFDNFYQCNYEVWGSKGKLTCTRAFTPPPGFSPFIIIEKQGEKEDRQLKADNHYRNMLTHCVNKINELNFKDEYQEILIQAKLIEEVKTIAYE